MHPSKTQEPINRSYSGKIFNISTHLCLVSPKWGGQKNQEIAKKNRAFMGYTKNYGPVSPNFCTPAPRALMILNSVAFHDKTEHGIFVKLKNQQNCCDCRCHHLGVLHTLAHHCTIWCQSTFRPLGPGQSNPTSFLRLSFQIAQTTTPCRQTKHPPPEPSNVLKRFHGGILSERTMFQLLLWSPKICVVLYQISRRPG